MSKKRRGVNPTPAIDDSWRARSDMSTLAEAESIKADRARLKAAQSEAAREAARLSKVVRHTPAKAQRATRAPRNSRLEKARF
jgi:hypothetical protein